MSISTNRNMLIIIAALLVINVAMLVYFLGQKKGPKDAMTPGDKGKPNVAEMLQKEVGFDTIQTARYKEMKEKQRERVRPMYDNMRKAKDSLFRLLSFPDTPDSVLTRAAETIATQQKELDLETFNHFKRVRLLCKPDQLEKYDSMVLRMFRKMGKPVRHAEQEKK